MAGTNNNSGVFDPFDIASIFAQVLQNNMANGNTLADNEFSRELLSKLDGIFKNTSKVDVKEAEKAFKEVLTLLRSVYGNNAELTNLFKNGLSEVKRIISKGDVSDKLLVNLLTSLTSLAHSLSDEAKSRGEKGMLGDKPKDKITAEKLQSIFKTAVQESNDSLFGKLMNFFREDQGREKTRMRQFREDLVEGLARSKFFGGAIMDLIKLGTLFVASWLKDKGTIGKILAVTLVAAAPVIATAIVKAVTSLITNVASKVATAVFSSIGSLAKSIGNWVKNIIQAIGMSRVLGGAGRMPTTGKLATQTRTSSVLLDRYGKPLKTPISTIPAGATVGKGLLKGVGKGVVGAVVGMGVEWGAYKAVESGVDPRLAHGASGATQGVITGALLGSWIPGLGTAIGAGIGGAVGGLIGLIKGHYDRQESLGESQLRELKEGRRSGFWGHGRDNESSIFSSGRGQRVSGSGTFAGHRITSPFGMRVHPKTGEVKQHTGIDLDYNYEDVPAYMGGRVMYAGPKGGYGNAVVIKDKNGVEHLYGHLHNISQEVYNLAGSDRELKAGQIIGISGATGVATGPHLHFETKTSEGYTDPIAYLSSNGVYQVSSKDRSKFKDKFAQNVIDYWDSQGKDKGFLHSKAHDYAKLAEQYKEEYVKEVAKIDPFGYNGGINSLNYQSDRARAITSQEAKDYANRKIAEYVSNAKSIKVALAEGGVEQAEEIKDVTASATEQARAQWGQINQKFKDEAKNEEIVIPPDKQPIIDFTGTEYCSKVLQNVVNAQQQTFIQR